MHITKPITRIFLKLPETQQRFSIFCGLLLDINQTIMVIVTFGIQMVLTFGCRLDFIKFNEIFVIQNLPKKVCVPEKKKVVLEFIH